MKRCSRCQESLPEASFQRDAKEPSGLKSACRECRGGGGKAFNEAEARGLQPFATGDAALGVEALIEHGSIPAAAESLGWTPRQLRLRLGELQRTAARRGWAPTHDMARAVPEGFHVKGVSTLYGADGTVRGQWVKSNRDAEHRVELVLQAVQDVALPFKGAAEPVAAPETSDEDLLCVYPFGDPHFGMYAWADESGENFDIEIAERDLVAAVDALVALAPPSKEALIISLGDMFHADSKRSTTTAGTPVDTDSRWSKVLAVVIRTMRRCIDQALTKHEIVNVICASGNHDDLTSLVLAVCLSQYYEREPRVRVETSPAKFYYFRFGSCLLGVHHGDTAKLSDLPAIMACDRSKDWGETDERLWYTGHIHHEKVQEYPGVIVEAFRTLAPKDAWHAAQGYRSGRDMRLDVLHKQDGRINRHIVGIQKIRRLRAEAKR